MEILFVVLVVLLLLLLSCLRIVSESNCYVVERLGRFKKEMHAGVNFKWPFFEKVVKKVSLKEQVVDFPPQAVITKDNVTMQIDTVVYFKINDARKYAYGVSNPMQAIENLTATTLRNIIGDLELDDTLTSRDTVNTQMRTILDEATDEWGIKITRVELKNIMPPREIQDAMEKQMKAERDRRETLLEAEGHKQAVVKREEGNKEARILEAEGKKAAMIADAEARAQSITLVYEAQARGLKTLMNTVGPEGLMILKKLETLEKVGNGRATKLIVPSDLTNTATDLTLKGEFLGLDKSMDVDTTPVLESVDEESDDCCEDIVNTGANIPTIPERPLPDSNMRAVIVGNIKKVTGATTQQAREACEKTGYKFKDAVNYLRMNYPGLVISNEI